jgi:hypothetical protein
MRSLAEYLAIALAFAIVELALQAGFYDRVLKRSSYAGKAVATRNRIEHFAEIGRLPDLVSLGDSRTQHALSERVVEATLAMPSMRYANLAIEGGGLPTVDAMALYLRDFGEDRPEVFVVGVDPRMITSGYLGDHELTLVAPFTSFWAHTREIDRLLGSLGVTERRWSLYFRLVAYRDDVADLLLHPSRIRGIWSSRTRAKSYENKKENMPVGDLCDFRAATAEECVTSARELLARTGEEQWQGALAICDYLAREKAQAARDVAVVPERVAQEWQGFLSRLGHVHRPLILLLPYHSLNRRESPEGALEASRTFLSSLVERSLAYTKDYTDLFTGERECEFFLDPFHLNRKGAEALSRRVGQDIRELYPEMFSSSRD